MLIDMVIAEYNNKILVYPEKAAPVLCRKSDVIRLRPFFCLFLVGLTMNADEFMASALIADAKRQLERMGFDDYEVRTAGSFHVVRRGEIEAPPLSLSLTQPVTVKQLLTFNNALYPRHLIEKDERIIAQTWMLAEAINKTPIAIVPEETAYSIRMDMARLEIAIKEMPAGRAVDDPAWHDKNYAKLISVGEAFRMMRDDFGGIENFIPTHTTNVAQERAKPGPVPLTMDEVIELVHEWKEWRRRGSGTQDNFCAFKGWGSRTPLTKALDRYRKQFGAKSA